MPPGKTLDNGAPLTPPQVWSPPRGDARRPDKKASETAKRHNTPSSIPGGQPRHHSNSGIFKPTPRGAGRRAGRKPAGRAEARRERDPDLVATLQASDIEVLLPGELEYERAVASSNLLYRFSRPTYVVRPRSDRSLEKIVQEACRRKLPVTIKNGGCSYAGSSFPNDGIMLDMKDMNKVTLDRANMEMIMEAGALWEDVYRTLVNEGDDTLMVNGGRCPSVGVSGFLLGGGIGPFSRCFGMGADDLKQVTICTAPDGLLYEVGPEDDPESDSGHLFWALCGAGGGNFGVVARIKMRVHQLPGSEVVAARHTWYPAMPRGRTGVVSLLSRGEQPEQDGGLLATMNHFYTHDWPDKMTIDSSWFSDLEVQNGELAIRFLAYYQGPQDEFNRLAGRGFLDAELKKQMRRRSLAEPTTRFLHESLSAQWDEETRRSTPANSSFRVFHSFCFTRDPDKMAKITAIVREELQAFRQLFAGGAAGLCQVSFMHSGGAMSQRERWATAFRWRETAFHTYILVQWRDKWLERDMRGFAHRFKDRLRHFSTAGKAALVSLADPSIPPTDHLKAYYGNNRARLQHVKRMWDPTGYFRRGQGIDLPPAPGDGHGGGPRAPADRAALQAGTRELELSDGDEDGPDAQADLAASQRWGQRLSTAPAPLLTSRPGNLALELGSTSVHGWNPRDCHAESGTPFDLW